MNEEKQNQQREKNFLFRERWYDQMRRLPDAEKLLVYDSICQYAFTHTTTEMAYYLESIMDNIRATIDADEQRQAAFHERQREKSRKGVEARARLREQSRQGSAAEPAPTPKK